MQTSLQRPGTPERPKHSVAQHLVLCGRSSIGLLRLPGCCRGTPSRHCAITSATTCSSPAAVAANIRVRSHPHRLPGAAVKVGMSRSRASLRGSGVGAAQGRSRCRSVSTENHVVGSKTRPDNCNGTQLTPRNDAGAGPLRRASLLVHAADGSPHRGTQQRWRCSIERLRSAVHGPFRGPQLAVEHRRSPREKLKQPMGA